MILSGTRDYLCQEIGRMFPGAAAALEVSKTIKPGLLNYQAMALFGLATQFNKDGATMLEIGTAVGYSASMMAQGAPLARITTLNPQVGEIPLAQKNLAPWRNVKVVVMYSWDYLAQTKSGMLYDMIFVDGDHNAIRRDLPWWDHVKPGGLMLFHDYTPQGAKKPSPAVFAELNLFGVRLGLAPDVSLIDDGLTGMVGWYTRRTRRKCSSKCSSR